MLDLNNLRGIFAAIPIAARPDGSFIEEDYRADIQAVCAAGVHGIYTTGTTGEWYALTDKEFQWMVEVFLEETSRFSTLTQIGCGGLCTQATVDRVRIAVRGPRRPDGLQILLPPWQPLTDDEVIDFFKAVAEAASGIPLIHYNTLRSKRLLVEQEYAGILPQVPTLIGSKTTISSIPEIRSLLRSGLPMNHFIGGESNLVAETIWGSKGVYSDFANYWPKASLRLFNLCQEKKWEEAIELEERYIAFELEGQGPLESRGYTDAAWDKGKAEAAGFLRCKRYIRPPHRSMSSEDIDHLRKVGQKYFAEWMTPKTEAAPTA
jgi:dihydrodipicolinate synthase/N-acetylneuraminate lyase